MSATLLQENEFYMAQDEPAHSMPYMPSVNRINVVLDRITFILEYFICILSLCEKLHSWDYFILSPLLNPGDKCNLSFL